MFDPHAMDFAGLGQSAYVRFSLLALSSIFFLVDPFAALPTFLAVTAGADAAERRKIALKASLTATCSLGAFSPRPGRPAAPTATALHPLLPSASLRITSSLISGTIIAFVRA